VNAIKLSREDSLKKNWYNVTLVFMSLLHALFVPLLFLFNFLYYGQKMQLASIATNRSQKRSVSTYKLTEIVPTPILFLQRDDNLTLCDRHVSI
jgi:hypothetical protein